MNVHDAACVFRTAQSEYQIAFQKYFDQGVPASDTERFWEIQHVFAREVIRFRFGYQRTNGVEQAARELFRKPLANDFDGPVTGHDGETVVNCLMTEATQFAKTWQELKRRLYQPLFDVVEDRGDDAYGDLQDALPLVGCDVVQKSLGREYGNHRQFEQAIREACKSCPRLAELILHGENYVGTALFDAARDYTAIARDRPAENDKLDNQVRSTQ